MPAYSPIVAGLRVFPFKSLDGLDVEAAGLPERGGLRLDRAYAFVDDRGEFVNAKKEPRLHALRVTYDPDFLGARFEDRVSGRSLTYGFGDDVEKLAAWAGRILGREIFVRRDAEGGFPDDTRAAGPTIVSTGTLQTVASWFEGLTVESVRRRLRSNIEIAGVPPFWEDSLFGNADEAVAFAIGDIRFEAINPCQRCAVPSRDPDSGAAIATFAKVVAERRAATLPLWVERSRFDHYYRLAVNTRATSRQLGKFVRIGQTVFGGLTLPAP